ncbi:MAG: hypothetical protein H0X63_12675 [Flavobacteriales bacterium]|nr:hypothetical protein [Flavobacteriales bacterium]
MSNAIANEFLNEERIHWAIIGGLAGGSCCGPIGAIVGIVVGGILEEIGNTKQQQ